MKNAQLQIVEGHITLTLKNNGHNVEVVTRAITEDVLNHPTCLFGHLYGNPRNKTTENGGTSCREDLTELAPAGFRYEQVAALYTRGLRGAWTTGSKAYGTIHSSIAKILEIGCQWEAY